MANCGWATAPFRFAFAYVSLFAGACPGSQFSTLFGTHFSTLSCNSHTPVIQAIYYCIFIKNNNTQWKLTFM
jgi:hypothetical protein